jgi:hypothetical protein
MTRLGTESAAEVHRVQVLNLGWRGVINIPTKSAVKYCSYVSHNAHDDAANFEVV